MKSVKEVANVVEFGHPSGLDRIVEQIDKNLGIQGVKYLDKLFLGATMPEDVRELFGYINRAETAQQKVKANEAERATFQDKANTLLAKITETGDPIVARMPNGDHYILFQDRYDGPKVEKVNVVNL